MFAASSSSLVALGLAIWGAVLLQSSSLPTTAGLKQEAHHALGGWDFQLQSTLHLVRALSNIVMVGAALWVAWHVQLLVSQGQQARQQQQQQQQATAAWPVSPLLEPPPLMTPRVPHSGLMKPKQLPGLPAPRTSRSTSWTRWVDGGSSLASIHTSMLEPSIPEEPMHGLPLHCNMMAGSDPLKSPDIHCGSPDATGQQLSLAAGRKASGIWPRPSEPCAEWGPETAWAVRNKNTVRASLDVESAVRSCMPSYSQTGSIDNRTSRAAHVQVVCVDPDACSQNALAGLLNDQGYDLLQMASGEELLEYLDACNILPDMVLIAMALPGLACLAVVDMLRLKWGSAQLPVILMASHRHDGQLVLGLEAGANDYIAKPIRPVELRLRLETHLALRKGLTLANEAHRNLSLLRSILPANIISKLKRGTQLVAEFHDQVTVLFTDIKGFTVMAQEWPTERIILMLNEMFTAFDQLCKSMSVYKIETIGDAYMVVSGHDGKPDHAVRMMSMASAMIKAVQRMTRWQGKQVQIRVGVHTGPAHAGVVGIMRPHYSFFGDTINTASRCESHGFPMAVHVSQATRDAVEAWQQQTGQGTQHQFVECGPRAIKGKGIMHTHLLKVGEWKAALDELHAQGPQEGAQLSLLDTTVVAGGARHRRDSTLATWVTTLQATRPDGFYMRSSTSSGLGSTSAFPVSPAGDSGPQPGVAGTQPRAPQLQRRGSVGMLGSSMTTSHSLESSSGLLHVRPQYMRRSSTMLPGQVAPAVGPSRPPYMRASSAVDVDEAALAEKQPPRWTSLEGGACAQQHASRQAHNLEEVPAAASGLPAAGLPAWPVQPAALSLAPGALTAPPSKGPRQASLPKRAASWLGRKLLTGLREHAAPRKVASDIHPAAGYTACESRAQLAAMPRALTQQLPGPGAALPAPATQTKAFNRRDSFGADVPGAQPAGERLLRTAGALPVRAEQQLLALLQALKTNAAGSTSD